jgi:hypothetical protein
MAVMDTIISIEEVMTTDGAVLTPTEAIVATLLSKDTMVIHKAMDMVNITTVNKAMAAMAEGDTLIRDMVATVHTLNKGKIRTTAGAPNTPLIATMRIATILNILAMMMAMALNMAASMAAKVVGNTAAIKAIVLTKARHKAMKAMAQGTAILVTKHKVVPI